MRIRIENDHQLATTKTHRADFERSLTSLRENPPSGLDPVLVRAQEDSLASVIQEMDEEISRYERERS